MFKFLSGVAIGWTSARILPPPPSDQPAWQPPTMAELRILGLAANRAFGKVKKWLDDQDNDQRADKTRFS